MAIFPANALSYQRAAQCWREGGLVAMPTETVYGLGANALDDCAVAAIYALKERPSFNPLIVHITDAQMSEKWVEWNDASRLLAQHFWPGPLTLVLKRTAECPLSLLVSAGLESVALRSPAHPVARALLETAGLPIAAPSANRSGRISPTTAQHVEAEFAEKLGTIIDGGACMIGLESTVIDCTGQQPMILRPGSITLEDIERKTGLLIGRSAQGEAVAHYASPGMLESHYAPSLPVRLMAMEAEAGEALLAFGPCAPAQATLNLSKNGNLHEAAANLFAFLRQLDSPAYRAIAVMPIPEQGLGEAINDRLRRAAAPRG